MNLDNAYVVKVTASFGALVPSLENLGRAEPAGYREMSEWCERISLADEGFPDGWFLAEHGEFTPTLFVAGAVYRIDAASEERALGRAEERFRTELAALAPPSEPESVFALLDEREAEA